MNKHAADFKVAVKIHWAVNSDELIRKVSKLSKKWKQSMRRSMHETSAGHSLFPVHVCLDKIRTVT